MPAFSQGQQKTLALLPILPSLLSLIGSTTIAHRVVVKEKKRSSYDRILLGLSCFDILFSPLVVLHDFLVDKEHSDLEWAVGNEASCNAMAFVFLCTSIPSVLYNGGLSLYFLATIRFGMTQEHFSRKYEPFLHFFAICYPLSTAIAGLVLDLFAVQDGDDGVPCWVAEEHTVASWLFGVLPFMFSMITIVIANITIYLFVRNTVRQSTRRSMTSESDARRIRKVAVQAFLYVASFFSSYIWTLFVVVASVHANDSAPFPLRVLSTFFFPMQGFWNGFIFVRPRYLRFRGAFKDESRFVAMRWALWGGDELPVELRHQNTTAPEEHESSHPRQMSPDFVMADLPNASDNNGTQQKPIAVDNEQSLDAVD